MPERTALYIIIKYLLLKSFKTSFINDVHNEAGFHNNKLA